MTGVVVAHGFGDNISVFISPHGIGFSTAFNHILSKLLIR